MCGYFFIGFIDFMLKNKSLTDFTNLVSPNDVNHLNLDIYYRNYTQPLIK